MSLHHMFSEKKRHLNKFTFSSNATRIIPFFQTKNYKKFNSFVKHL